MHKIYISVSNFCVVAMFKLLVCSLWFVVKDNGGIFFNIPGSGEED